jgi:serine/threonine protein phosphatase PrpC
MSRSIGDKAGKSLGIISTPAVTTYRCVPDCDMFIIVASDGLWDVMENEEAVNFVQHYRRDSKKEEIPTETEIVTPISVPIAQLLCEEARYRWKYIVEDEDVMVDDISAVVLELRPPESIDDDANKQYTRAQT